MQNNERPEILITFDYELFLGERSGTVENCLIIPTYHLLEVLNKHHVTAIFFIDTIYLFRLKEMASQFASLKKDYEQITRQLSEIKSSGHYIFHHVHPHWLYATYNDQLNQWEHSAYSRFAVSTLSEKEREQIFSLSKIMMTEIFQDAREHNGFRAGGLYIQPFHFFTEGFNELNIRYDFSVLPGFKSQENDYGFDFMDSEELQPYKFSNDVIIKDQAGERIEFPISSHTLKDLFKIRNSILNRFSKESSISARWGNGIGSKNKIYGYGKGSLFLTIETFSVELLTDFKLNSYAEFIRRNSYLHMISHPKLISARQVKLFDNFLEKLQKNSGAEFDFKNFSVLKSIQSQE